LALVVHVYASVAVPGGVSWSIKRRAQMAPGARPPPAMKATTSIVGTELARGSRASPAAKTSSSRR